MERRLVYPVRQAPDAALSHLERSLRREGFSVSDGREHDLAARRGADRVFVGLGPHPGGLVARVKGKALVPGRGADLIDRVEEALTEHLGPPVQGGGSDRA